jgi:UDP-glucose 4-epimerase
VLPFAPGTRVLLTGATGFIGSRIAESLRAMPGVECIGLSRRAPSDAPGMNVEAPLAGLTSDIWAKHRVDRIDVVLHVGGYIPKDASTSEAASDVLSANIAGTHALLESLPSPPRSVVYASTVDVYAPSEGTISESTPLGPTTLYAASKLYCEQLVRSHAKANAYSFAVLRYGHIFGPGEAGYEKAIPTFIRGLLAGNAPSLMGDGSALRDFLYVGDAVEATLRAADCSDRIDGPINVVRGASVSILEIVRILSDLVANGGEIEFRESRSPPRSLSFDNAKMVENLGRWPLTSLRDGLALELEYFRRLLR